jgi:hypothetical protein
MSMFDYEVRKGEARLLHLKLMFEKGAYISKNRNELTMKMYEEDCDAILMIDHDQFFPPETLERMVEAMERTGRGIVAGNVALQQGAHTTGFKIEGENTHRSVSRVSNEPESRVDTIASSCVLVHRRVFDKISTHVGDPKCSGPPWFGPGTWWMLTPIWDDRRKVWLERGEDFSFSWRAREVGEAPMLLVWDLGIKHYKVSCIEARTEVAA